MCGPKRTLAPSTPRLSHGFPPLARFQLLRDCDSYVCGGRIICGAWFVVRYPLSKSHKIAFSCWGVSFDDCVPVLGALVFRGLLLLLKRRFSVACPVRGAGRGKDRHWGGPLAVGTGDLSAAAVVNFDLFEPQQSRATPGPRVVRADDPVRVHLQQENSHDLRSFDQLRQYFTHFLHFSALFHPAV